MFKQASIEDELFQSMQKNLVSNQADRQHGFSKLAQAIDLLNETAEIFDQANMSDESAEITEIIAGLVNK